MSLIEFFKPKRVSFFLNACVVGSAFILLVFLILNSYFQIRYYDDARHFSDSNSRHFKANLSFRNIQIMSKRPAIVWSDAPEFALICHVDANSVMEFYNIFLVGYHLFWPKDQWPNSDLVVVLDGESELDHRMATVLVNLPPYPKVYFDKIPSDDVFCSNDKRIGYSRKQFSKFFSDVYTNRDYVGIVDSDSMFATHIIPENLFVNGKPLLLG